MMEDVLVRVPSRVADFIDAHRDEVVHLYERRARGIAATQGLSEDELLDSLPLFLSELARRLRHQDGSLEVILDNHVSARIRQGFGIEEVVNEISLVGPCLFELWTSVNPAVPAEPGEVSEVFDELQHVSARAAARLTEHMLDDEQSDKRYARLLERIAAEALTEGPEGKSLRARHDEILAAIVQITGADAAALVLPAAEGETLEFAASHGSWDPIFVEDTQRARPASFAARLAASAEPASCVATDESGDREAVLRSILGARVWARGQLLGLVMVGFSRVRSFSRRDIWRIETLAGRLALLLDEARLWDRLRAQNERLRLSEERFRLLLENVKDYAIVMLAADGTIESWNRGAEEITGHRAEDVTGKNLSTLYPAADRERGKAQRVLDTALAQGRFEEEGPRVRKDGSTYWASVVITPVFGEDGALRGFAKVTRDISERRRAEALLREKDARFRQAVELAEVGTWSYDPVSGLVRWDDRVRALWGVRPGVEINYDLFLAGVHPDDRQRVKESVDRMLGPDGSGLLKDEYRTIGVHDGVERWVAVQGRVLAEEPGRRVTFGAVREITETKHMVEALRESEQRLRKAEEVNAIAAELAGFSSFEFWPEMGQVVGSAEMKRQFGLSLETEVTYDLVMAGIHPQDRGRVVSALEAALRSGSEGTYASDFRTIGRDDHKERWLQMRGRAFFDEQGRAVRLVGGSVDITDRKRLDELREGLFGIVGHDLRNPLNAIKMASETLLRTLPPQHGRTVDIIVRSADRMNKMIHQLLDFTRVRFAAGLALERETVELTSVCREVIAETEVAHPERHVRLTVKGDCTGLWDRGRLAEAMSNLVGNAIQHGDPASPIDVVAACDTDEVVVDFHNRGAPIPPELLPMVFDPFRGRPAGRGGGASLGLGLYITREIVRAHGGEIDVRSTARDGTTVTMRLPRRHQNAH